MNTIETRIEESIILHAVNGLFDIVNDMSKDDTFDIEDLHQRLFNDDYFIIGYYKASEWLKNNKLDAFDVIAYVQEYEKEQLGETSTPINSEAMVNMYSYIRGEELLQRVDIDWNNPKYTKNQMTDLALEMKSLLG